MRDVRQAYRREPVFRDSHSPNRRAAMRLDEILRSLETAATQLRNRVNNGDGVEETRRPSPNSHRQDPSRPNCCVRANDQ